MRWISRRTTTASCLVALLACSVGCPPKTIPTPPGPTTSNNNGGETVAEDEKPPTTNPAAEIPPVAAINKAIKFGKPALMQPDWKRVFEPQEIAESIKRIT